MSPRSVFLLLLMSMMVAGRGKGGGGRGRGGGSHSYSHSNGYSGTGTGGSHSYPGSTGLSGDSHGHGIQGQRTNQQHNTYHSHKTEIQHHYHYSPPQQISYGAGYHPVSHSPPPVYVYEYRDSGSRFDNLLTGLALYNLGRMSASSSHHHYDSNREYRGHPDEVCKMGISKQNGEYEETRIDCKLMSSFIWDMESEHGKQQAVSTNTITTTVNVTGTNGSSVTTSVVENKTVVDALQVKGPSLEVTPGMNCFMIRYSRDSSILKKKVECGLLQAYAVNSLHYNKALRVSTEMKILVITFVCILMCLHL